MLRLYDWECTKCGAKREALVLVPHGAAPPKTQPLPCTCVASQKDTKHRRLLSRPAQYLGERPLNVVMRGGSCDTMGYKPLPDLPEFPDNGSADDFCDFVQRPEYKEAKKQRAAVERENRTKRKRAAALKRGDIKSMRHCPLPGDPSWK